MRKRAAAEGGTALIGFACAANEHKSTETEGDDVYNKVNRWFECKADVARLEQAQIE